MVIDLQVYRYSVYVYSYIAAMLYYSWSGVDNCVFLHYNSTSSHSIHVHVLQFSFTRLYITSFKRQCNTKYFILKQEAYESHRSSKQQIWCFKYLMQSVSKNWCSDWGDKNLKCIFIILGLNFLILVSKDAFCQVKLAMMCPPLLPYMSHTLLRMKSVHRIKVDNLDLYNFNLSVAQIFFAKLDSNDRNNALPMSRRLQFIANY